MGRFHWLTLLVVCCRYKQDANRIRKALGKRLERYKLKLNKEKTRLISFSKRAYDRGMRRETFDFLGFTFYLGKTIKGKLTAKLKTKGERKTQKLKNVGKWAREIRNQHKLPHIWGKFKAKLRGHLQYYGVSHNGKSVKEFKQQSIRILFKWLNRRSQKKSFTWEKWNLFIERYPPPEAKIYHKLF